MIGEKENGQSLIEILIALGIFLVIVSSLVILTISALNNANTSGTRRLATVYAQDAIEELKSLKADDEETFFDNYQQNCQNLAGTKMQLTRSLTCNLVDGETKLEVSVLVEWSDAVGSHSVTRPTFLTKWKKQ